MNLRARVRSGDPEAFGELFAEHARSVYNHSFRLTGNWSTAEDVASLTILEAWRLRERIDVDRDTGDEAASLRPWLLGIATNIARNVRRAARRHDGALLRMPHPETVPDIAEDVTSRTDDRERLAVTMASMKKLRKTEREVIALVVWAELDYTQAAEALGVPVGTVASRLSRARAKLAKLVSSGRLKPAETKREVAPRRGQVRDDRDKAVRLAQEINR
ncbi:RNA polymerase sigma factor [Phytomonospora sp. NPDC050363]|uniref:RNA polymerase sigma factor n=1 Tax=Phytomonospora sp. NPDC050363 TaxID=3155642 RepID=UPI0033D67901